MAPPNEAIPSMSGAAGSSNMPSALTRTSASTRSPEAVVTRQLAEPSSQAAPVTSTPKRQWGSTP